MFNYFIMFNNFIMFNYNLLSDYLIVIMFNYLNLKLNFKLDLMCYFRFVFLTIDPIIKSKNCLKKRLFNLSKSLLLLCFQNLKTIKDFSILSLIIIVKGIEKELRSDL
jgi:hypothetical protein